MANNNNNNNNNKKTQKDPEDKGKGKDNDKQLTLRAVSQSGQHNASARGDETGSGLARRPLARPPRVTVLPPNTITLGSSTNKLGQTDICHVRQDTGAPVTNAMGLTRFGTREALGLALNDHSSSALAQVGDAARQLVGPGDTLEGLFWSANANKFVQVGNKRKIINLGYTPQSRLAAGRPMLFSDEDKASDKANKRSSDQQDVEAESQGNGQDQGPRPQKRQRRVFCVGCKSNKHTLAVCLKAGVDGYMKGCPFCDTLEHSAGNCPRQELKDDKTLKVRYFVYKRRNMPSFLNIKAWYPLVKKNIHHRYLDGDSHFPWTPEFTKSNAGRIDELQRKIDDQGPGAYLPVDPKVKGWSTAVAYCESLKRDDQEKALAEARAKVTPLTPAQKALAAMMSMSDEPDASWLEVKEDERHLSMAGNTPVEPAPEDQRGVTPVPEEQHVAAPKDESDVFALAKAQKEKVDCQSWAEEVEDDDEGADSDEDLDDDALRRKMDNEIRADRKRLAIRAKSHASEQ